MKNRDNWCWKVYRFYWNNLTPRIIYYNIKNGVTNLINWLPIIWQDRDWDEYYLYAIMCKKFEQMEHFHRDHGITVSAPKNAHELMVCKNLCRRLMEDEYTSPYEKRNMPHFDWFSEKFEQSIQSESDENGFITIVDHYEPDEPDSRWILPAHGHEENLAKQDIELLTKLMRKYMRGWWD